ncbi:hypothetical protein GCM10025789_11160 [Tessaracoccus lubricantis]|uniref:DUF559 domain-containing protein n=1 Tax=Tessaracoccus lubricantis TaxID=545543 RepID=A0ABP9FG57_9ACTN
MRHIFTMQELFEQGWKEAEVPQAIVSGALTRLRRGAFTQSTNANRARIDAGVKACSPKSVVSHASAALLHQLPVRRKASETVHLTRTRTSGGRNDRDVHLYSCPVQEDEIVKIGDLKVTNLGRTVVDLARHEPPEWALAAGDAALRAGLSEHELDLQLIRAAKRPGIRQARRVVGLLDGLSESAGESISRWLLSQSGLPMPQLQVELTSHGELARVDFFWPELGLIGEFDGKVKYGRTLKPNQDPGEVVFAEKRREDGLRAQGYLVIRWTWADLKNPATFIAMMRAGMELAARVVRPGS